MRFFHNTAHYPPEPSVTPTSIEMINDVSPLSDWNTSISSTRNTPKE